MLRVGGSAFFPAMLAAIDGARDHILLEMYLARPGSVLDRFLAALCRAAERGVAVYVLFDDLGAREVDDESRARLIGAGVRLRFYNPLALGRGRLNLHRNHRKLLLVDGHTAFIGGAGLVDDFDPGVAGVRAWHDLMIELKGPCAQDWQELFADVWASTGGERLEVATRAPAAAGDAAGRVSATRGAIRPEFKRALLAGVRRARRRVWLATAYFAPPRRLRRFLVRAARRGVDVRLLLPGPHADHPAVWYAGRRFYAPLLKRGVRIFEYQPSFLHAKYSLCDDWSSVGSANLDHWTLHWNLEANQEFDDGGLAAEMAALFEADCAQAREITWARWRKRSWWERLWEALWGWVDTWVARRAYRLAVRAALEREREGADATRWGRQ